MELRDYLGLDNWKRIFPVILTDNGIEFKIDGTKKFSLFDIKDIPNKIFRIL